MVTDEKFNFILKIMKNKTTIYYDFEATSVARDADSISLGLVTERLINIVKYFQQGFLIKDYIMIKD